MDRMTTALGPQAHNRRNIQPFIEQAIGNNHARPRRLLSATQRVALSQTKDNPAKPTTLLAIRPDLIVFEA